MPRPTSVRIAFFVALLAVVTCASRAMAQYTDTVLHTFGVGSDGAVPEAGLIFDAQGNLYGTTYSGGAYGAGTVFRLSPQSDGSWAETELFEFTNGVDGGSPNAAVIMDAAGNLYGTTAFGGSPSCIEVQNSYGEPCGVVFKLTPQAHGRWRERILHSFQANVRDGFYPFAGLVFDASGNLYGATSYGGANNLGVIFELSPDTTGPWKEKILHSFSGPDGSIPYNTLTIDRAGNLYGVTRGGGITNTSTCTSYGCGVVLELSPTASGRWNEHVLYSFTNTTDGAYPFGALAFDSSGNLYGTGGGGNSTGCSGYPCGVVFELSHGKTGGWTEQVLYNFQGGSDGEYPGAGVVFDSAGNLYGTTPEGGVGGCIFGSCGTVFELSPSSGGDWTEQVLYRFTGSTDGCLPSAGVILDSSGNVYSTAVLSGLSCQEGGNSGNVFELSPPVAASSR